MIVHSQSIIYQLANKYGGGIRHDDDSCSFTSKVFKAILKISSFVLVIGWVAGEVLAWATVSFMMGSFVDFNQSLGFIVMCMVGVFALGSGVFLCTLVLFVVDEYQHAKHRYKTPGVISQMIDRIHNKFCSNLEIRD